MRHRGSVKAIIVPLLSCLGIAVATAPAQAQYYEPSPPAEESAGRKPPLPAQWQRPVLGIAYAGAPFIAYFGSDAAGSYWPAVPAWFLAPSVHWASRRGWRAGISLAMQPASAYTGWMLGIAATRGSCHDENDDDCGSETALAGAVVGYFAWAIADLVLVSNDRPAPLEEEQPWAARVSRRKGHLTPVLAATPEGGLFGGFAGRF